MGDKSILTKGQELSVTDQLISELLLSPNSPAKSCQSPSGTEPQRDYFFSRLPWRKKVGNSKSKNTVQIERGSDENGSNENNAGRMGLDSNAIAESPPPMISKDFGRVVDFDTVEDPALGTVSTKSFQDNYEAAIQSFDSSTPHSLNNDEYMTTEQPNMLRDSGQIRKRKYHVTKGLKKSKTTDLTNQESLHFPMSRLGTLDQVDDISPPVTLLSHNRKESSDRFKKSGGAHSVNMPAVSRRRISSQQYSLTNPLNLSLVNPSNAPHPGQYDMTPSAGPRKLFVQLDEYCADEYGLTGRHYWKEIARWIKYEEDLEESSSRWGRPHVPILSFHGLAELRKRLEIGSIMLDLEETDFMDIMRRICRELRDDGHIRTEEMEPLLNCLTKPHKHYNKKKSILPDPKRSLQYISSKISMSKITTRNETKEREYLGRENASFIGPNTDRDHNPDVNHPETSVNNLTRQPVSIKFSKPLSSSIPPGSSQPTSSSLISRLLNSFQDRHPRWFSSDAQSKQSSRDNVPYPDYPRESAIVMIGLARFLASTNNNQITAFVRLKNPVLFPTGILENSQIPVRFLFVILGGGPVKVFGDPSKIKNDPEVAITANPDAQLTKDDDALYYRELGRAFATLLSNEVFNEIAYRARSCKDLTSGFNSFLKNSIVLPPGEFGRSTLMPITHLYKEQLNRKRVHKDQMEWAKNKGLSKKMEGKMPSKDDDSLPSCRGLCSPPFAGLIADYKRKLPFYASDFTSAFKLQCVSTFLFIYFACLSPCITFGGILSTNTENWMGVSEMMMATALGGCIFALFSGQPLTIIGATGPILIFENSLYKFSIQNRLNYLSFRVWVAMWVFIITLIFLAVQGGYLIKYLTRFIQEIFSIIISFIYIYETFTNLIMMFRQHPLLPDYCHLNITIDPSLDGGKSTLDFFSFFFPRIPPSALTSHTTAINENFERFRYPVDTGSVGNVSRANGYVYKIPYYELRFPSDYSLVELGAGKHLQFESYVSRFSVTRPNTALFCTLLIFGTFFIAYFLKVFRNSKFFGRNARRALADFGVPIAIFTMLGVAHLVGRNVYTPKLNVPNSLTPTAPHKRGWIIRPLHGGATPQLPSVGGINAPTFYNFTAPKVDPYAVPAYLYSNVSVRYIFVAIFPALMIFTLLFLEGMITSHIVNRKDRKFIKGAGYNMDLLILGSLPLLHSFLGLPFISGATVRSLAHVSSLTVYSRNHTPGESPAIIGVLEQRVTAFSVALCIGVSIFFSTFLQKIPIAILFGIFLYLGISSLKGVQFFDRILIILMPLKHYPTLSYVQKTGLFKLHFYTLIQISCLIALWAVKSSVAAQAFPFVLIIYILIRFQLKWIYTPAELYELDKDDMDDNSDDEIDVNEEVHMPI
ncbi:unnamed protein product [Gordionus sp. m RMFG-2023]